MRYVIPAFAALVLATCPLAVQAQTPVSGQLPAAQSSAAQSSAAQTPAAQTPAAQTPAAQTPAKPNRLAKRFASANTTHDGHLTLDQAKLAKWTQVVKRFAKIDSNSKGYVTEQEIRTAAAQARAARPAPAGNTGTGKT